MSKVSVPSCAGILVVAGVIMGLLSENLKVCAQNKLWLGFPLSLVALGLIFWGLRLRRQ